MKDQQHDRNALRAYSTAYFNARRQALETFVASERAALAQAETDLMAALVKAPTTEKPAPPSPPRADKTLSRKQVAEMLGVCVQTVQRLTRRGQLLCLMLNRRLIRYETAVVEQFLRPHLRQPRTVGLDPIGTGWPKREVSA